MEYLRICWWHCICICILGSVFLFPTSFVGQQNIDDEAKSHSVCFDSFCYWLAQITLLMACSYKGDAGMVRHLISIGNVTSENINECTDGDRQETVCSTWERIYVPKGTSHGPERKVLISWNSGNWKDRESRGGNSHSDRLRQVLEKYSNHRN